MTSIVATFIALGIIHLINWVIVKLIIAGTLGLWHVDLSSKFWWVYLLLVLIKMFIRSLRGGK
ncbi:hypothetical protein LCGC14_0305840 [marine sediment metagenome]|uniref:Uncharacterized protein n=1 Tax=marine sediment metagenome TaxID=412755 RepID=A0A0F9TNX6_9ZZZZ